MSAMVDSAAQAKDAAKTKQNDLGVARTRAYMNPVVVRILQVVAFIVIFGGWELAIRLRIADPFFFSQPSHIIERAWTWIYQGSIWHHLATTMTEAALGFLLGTLGGVAAGMAFARIDMLAAVFDPYIRILNALPRVILAPIFLLWFGLGISSKVALAASLVFFVVFFNTFQGVREVDITVLNNARMLQANDRQLLRYVYVPSAMSWIFSSLHTSVGFALVAAVVGEYMGSSQGMGYLIQNSQGLFDTTGVMAGLLITSTLVLVVDVMITKLEAHLLRWRPQR
jgi:NitT/TauT family transport system permease protein